jgi:hypothetical protein
MPTYTLTRDLGAFDVRPHVEFSADLVDWATHPPALVSGGKQPEGTAVLIYRGPWPLGDPTHPRGFFRTRAAPP